MILFENDWNKFPEAIVDHTGPNKSFLNYALLLKKMGVKNWKWPLALLNPDLQGKDPFDPKLTLEEQQLFAIEFKLNPWAYFRMAARAPGNTDEIPFYFIANRSNMALLWLYFNHITVCLVQIRQTGKTFAVCSLDVYLMNVKSKGGRTLLLTKDEKLREKTMTDMKTIEELIPFYLKQHHKNDIGNKEEFNVSYLDNNYKALIARNDPIAASKTGRGHTVENTRFDETAYLFFIKTAVRAMLAATTRAKANAEILGNPYGNIFLTTAGKRDDRDGEYAYNYFHNSANWTEFLLDCENEENLKKTVKTASKDGDTLRVHCVFSHRQLGYTDEWLRETAKENDSSGEDYERDYLNKWTFGSQNSPFSVEDSRRMRESQREVMYGEISKYGQILIRWYIKEENIERLMNAKYTIIALDTSDGMGKDDITITIRDLQNGEVLAVASINEINLITVSHFLVDLIRRFSKATMIIERRNQAATIIDFMHKELLSLRIDPFKRLYNLCVQEYNEYPDRFEHIQNQRNWSNENFLAQYKKFFGFATSGSGITSRSLLYSTTLRQAVKYTSDLIYDAPTIDQLLSLVDKDGRIDHPPGGHDDHCVTWLLTYWFMTNARNLQYYGIPSGYVMSNNSVVNSPANQQQQYDIDLNRRYKLKIEDLSKQLKEEKDPNVAERLIFQLQNIKNILGDKHEVSISVDEMLNSFKNKKMITSYTKRSLF